MTNDTQKANFHQEKWLDCLFDDYLGLVFEFFLIYEHKTHLTKVIWPQYMLICSIHLYFCGKFCTRVNIYHISNIYEPGPSEMGIYSGLCWIFESSWVQMKGLGVYYHCAQADFLTYFCPRAMGPSPWSTGAHYITI